MDLPIGTGGTAVYIAKAILYKNSEMVLSRIRGLHSRNIEMDHS